MQNIVEVIKSKKARILEWHENCLNHWNAEISFNARRRERVIKKICEELDECIFLLTGEANCKRVSLEQFEKICEKTDAEDIEILIDDSFVRCAVVTIYDRDKMHSNEEVDDIDIEACDCDMELNDPYSGMSSDEAFELAQCMDNDLLWDLFSNEIPGISHLYIVYVASDSVIKGV